MTGVRVSPKVANALVWLGLIVGLAGPLVVLVAVLGRMANALDWQTAFGTLTVQTAPNLAKAGIVAGVAALIAAVWARPRWMWAVAALAVLAPAITLAMFAGLRAQARAVPPIHDVATNWEEPLSFSEALMTRRGPEANPVEADPRLDEPWRPAGGAIPEAWAASRVADLNRLACPGARPVPRLVPAAVVQTVLEDHGVLVSGTAPWRVEGTWRSTWFHFEDDVAVRMRPNRTDVRSVSRVGQSDLGANCERVSSIVRALDAASR